METKKINKYQQGKIYKIINTVDDKIYFGSTTRKLNLRFNNHRSDCKKVKNATFPLYQHMNKLGIDKFMIVLVETVPCNNIKELEAKEKQYILNNKSSLNKKVPLRTDKEYRETNKDIIHNKTKRFRVEHKEEITLMRKRRCVCECGTDIIKDSKARHQKTKFHQDFIRVTELD